jgi:hypothetical protein
MLYRRKFVRASSTISPPRPLKIAFSCARKKRLARGD